MAAAAARPSSRYSSLDSRSSSSTASHLSSPSPSPAHSSKHVSSLRRLISTSGGSSGPSMSPSRAVVKTRSGDPAAGSGQKLGSMVRKLMDRRSNKAVSSDEARLVVASGRVAEDLKKTVAAAAGGRKKESNLASLHRKLFQKGGSGGDRTPAKALGEVKPNTRTLAMVLRNERELLTQNAEYAAEISRLRMLLEEKEREVDKLKDLCLKQKEEIKALKDAILFPDVMNTQLHALLEKQGSELKQAKRVIPILEKQVTCLTGRLQCLADDLAETFNGSTDGQVKADKYTGRSCFDGHGTSPRTPTYDHKSPNSLEFSSEGQIMPGSPDDMFLKDLNPCLTPCFPKSKSKEYDEMMGYTYGSFGSSTVSSSDIYFSSPSGKLSKSSEHCQKHRPGRTTQKTCKSEENKWTTAKQMN